MPYEVVIQERKRVDLYGNVVYYIYWFDKYGYNITNEWKFWSKGSKKQYDRVNRYLTDSWLKEYCGNICDKHIRETDVSPNGNTIRMEHEQVAIVMG